MFGREGVSGERDVGASQWHLEVFCDRVRIGALVHSMVCERAFQRVIRTESSLCQMKEPHSRRRGKVAGRDPNLHDWLLSCRPSGVGCDESAPVTHMIEVYMELSL